MGDSQSKLYYAAIWRRFLAFVIDGILFLPLMFGCNWVLRTSPRLYAVIYIPFGAVNVCYWVVCHAIWGKSIGKHCMGIWLSTLDGSRIGWSHALRRQLPWICLSIVAAIAFIPIYLKIPLAGYAEMSNLERGKLIRSMWPDWFSIFYPIQNAWMIGTIVVMFFNRKRRALHDFIAGTVVIQKHPTKRQQKQDDPFRVDVNKEMKRLSKL